MSFTVLSTSHPTILEFYQQHPIDFETMNLLFVDLLKKMVSNMDTSIPSSIASKIGEKINLLEHKVGSLTSLLESKMNEYRKDYIQDLKHILISNNVEQINPLIRETNGHLLDKTSLILNEWIPKNNDTIKKEIQIHFQEFQKTLLQETNLLLSKSIHKDNIEENLRSFQEILKQSNQSLITFVSSSETRIGNHFGDIHSKIMEIKNTMRENDISPLKKKISDILLKFENNTEKGSMSENVLYNVLVHRYSSAEINYVGDKKETGDIMFQQKNRPRIIIENKDHEANNVPKKDVDKFIRDCDIQNCCGIMLAQHRGISNKENFEIQINNGNILLYIHETKFDIDKISLGIEIVENLKIKMDELGISNADYVIGKDLLEEINQEYNFFIHQKTSLFKLIKDITDKINEMKLPNLDHFLSKRFAFSTSNQKENICKFCNEPVKKSVLQHQRYCSAKKDFDEKEKIKK
jgi:hypothetical protein